MLMINTHKTFKITITLIGKGAKKKKRRKYGLPFLHPFLNFRAFQPVPTRTPQKFRVFTGLLLLLLLLRRRVFDGSTCPSQSCFQVCCHLYQPTSPPLSNSPSENEKCQLVFYFYFLSLHLPAATPTLVIKSMPKMVLGLEVPKPCSAESTLTKSIMESSARAGSVA